MPPGRRKQVRASHQGRALLPNPVHPTLLPLQESAAPQSLPHAHHLASGWAAPPNLYTLDHKVESDLDHLSATREGDGQLPQYAYSDEDDPQDDYKVLLTPPESSTQGNLFSDMRDMDNMTSPIVDLQAPLYRLHEKTPHRKDIEAKARLKMRMASQRLRHSISPRVDGITLRGAADVMDRASELLKEYEAKISELENEIRRLRTPTMSHTPGFYNP